MKTRKNAGDAQGEAVRRARCGRRNPRAELDRGYNRRFSTVAVQRLRKALVVVPLFAGRKSDCQAVLRWW
jgi:hypothetical protein